MTITDDRPTTTCPSWCTTDHEAERAQQARDGEDPPQWHRHLVGQVQVSNRDDLKVIVERLDDEPIQVLVINAPDPLGDEVQLTVAQAGELGMLLLRATELIQRGA